MLAALTCVIIAYLMLLVIGPRQLYMRACIATAIGAITFAHVLDTRVGWQSLIRSPMLTISCTLLLLLTPFQLLLFRARERTPPSEGVILYPRDSPAIDSNFRAELDRSSPPRNTGKLMIM